MTECAPVVELRDVVRDYTGAVTTRVLHGIDLQVGRGELVALIGPSGSGKTTLLNVMGLLDRPTAGRVSVLGQDVTGLDETGRTALRGRALGFVFQSHHLLPALTAAENVALPLAIQGGALRAADLARATAMLETLGLGAHAGRRAGRLSGGQQQRVAIARALVHDPALVLADEPTGNLDSTSAEAAFDLMRGMNAKLGVAFLIVTHDPRVADRCRRVVRLADGRIAEDPPRTSAA